MFNSPLPSANELPSSQQLLRSTAIAIGVACALLVTVVMPSEYAVDPTGVGRVFGLTQMGELKIALEKEALADAESSPVAEGVAAPVPPAPVQAPQPEAANIVAQPAAPTAPVLKSNTMTVTLKPGEGTEIKLHVRNNSKVSYEWTTEGGSVNYDTHGEPYNGKKGYFHSYSKGKQVTEDKGEFTAIFDGTHGWFWRNRGNQMVTVSLKTSGDYLSVQK
jgi:hypothetical protein